MSKRRDEKKQRAASNAVARTSGKIPQSAIFQTAKAARQVLNNEARRVYTVDGFENFLARVGLHTDNLSADSTYDFDLITRNRVLLEAAYRGSWMVGAIVDSFAEDMTRAGIEVLTSDKSDLKKLYKQMTRLQIMSSFCTGEKWGRLYGGALGILDIEGQDMKTPLDPETVGRGQFKGVVIFDRWMLNPVLSPVIQSGPNMGLPMFYQIVDSQTGMEPTANTATGERTVHYSRVIRFTGIDLPYFQAITEMMWGESVLERVWDRLIAFDNASLSSGQLIDRANLRTISIANLREIIAAGGDAVAGLESQFEMMRRMQSNESITLLDKEDEFQSTSYSFAGLSDMMLQKLQELSGASGIPLVRLLGQSPAGLGANGEADIRMYYDTIKAQQEAKFRNGMDKVLKVLWRSTFGAAAPDDLEFEFVNLWQLSAVDKATVANTNTQAVVTALDAGLISQSTGMQELRAQSGDTGLFSNITDEQIEQANLEPPPTPDEAPEDNAASPDKKAEEDKKPEVVKDAMPSWLSSIFKRK